MVNPRDTAGNAEDQFVMNVSIWRNVCYTYEQHVEQWNKSSVCLAAILLREILKIVVMINSSLSGLPGKQLNMVAVICGNFTFNGIV